MINRIKTRDVIVGFVTLVILIAGVIFIFNYKNKRMVNSPLPTPNIVDQSLNDSSIFNIPDGVEKANLKDISGGKSMGVATRTEVVANLPELKGDGKYEVFLGNDKGDVVKLGSMHISKSGYILEYKSSNYPGYNLVTVSLKGVKILEGSF